MCAVMMVCTMTATFPAAHPRRLVGAYQVDLLERGYDQFDVAPIGERQKCDRPTDSPAFLNGPGQKLGGGPFGFDEPSQPPPTL